MKEKMVFIVFLCCNLYVLSETPYERMLIERLTVARNELVQVRSTLNSPADTHKQSEKNVNEAYEQILEYAFSGNQYDQPNSFLTTLIKRPDISKSIVLKLCKTQLSKQLLSHEERGRLVNHIIRTLYENKATIPDCFKGIELVLLENNYPDVYTAETKNIIKQCVLAAHLHFLFVDVVGIASDKEIHSCIRQRAQESKMCDSYNNFCQAWVVTCVAARSGDKVAYEKVRYTAKDLQDMRKALFVPLGMAYIGDKDMISRLFDMLKSNQKKWNGEDAVPQETQLAHEAASALTLCVKDFPKYENRTGFTEEDKMKCLKWVEEHQNSFVIEKKPPLFFLKNTRFSLLLNK
jgi:hypothetical protein